MIFQNFSRRTRYIHIKNFFNISENQKRKKSFHQSDESGRSMIELLGVLTIMALLSIGGIWGYQYAIASYQAGQIQDIVAKAKVLATSKRATSTQSLEKFLNKTALKSYLNSVKIEETTNSVGRVKRIYKVAFSAVPDTIQTALYARKSNFAKMDIMLAPSQDTVPEDEQDEDWIAKSWITAGMSEGAYEVLSPYAKLQSNQNMLISFETFSRRHSSLDDNENTNTTQCPADMPFYNPSTDSCSKCDTSLNEYWHPIDMKCVVCEDPKIYWDDLNYLCACPPEIPVYDSASNTCVECLSNSDCKSEAQPVCNSFNVCEPCPSGQFYDGAECRLNCEEKKVWDSNTQTCICDPTYYETDSNGYCVCRTEDVVEAQIQSTGISSTEENCRLHITDLGKLKGTYYFKWISGLHIVNIDYNAASFNVYLYAGTGETGKVTDTSLGKILYPDLSKYPYYPSDRHTYTISDMEDALSHAEPRYFTFDGTKMISLWFHDSYCIDNAGTMNVELRKVINYCPDAE